MDEALKMDSTLVTIADLPPEWRAHPGTINNKWSRQPSPDLVDKV